MTTDPSIPQLTMLWVLLLPLLSTSFLKDRESLLLLSTLQVAKARVQTLGDC